MSSRNVVHEPRLRDYLEREVSGQFFFTRNTRGTHRHLHEFNKECRPAAMSSDGEPDREDTGEEGHHLECTGRQIFQFLRYLACCIHPFLRCFRMASNSSYVCVVNCRKNPLRRCPNTRDGGPTRISDTPLNHIEPRCNLLP